MDNHITKPADTVEEVCKLRSNMENLGLNVSIFVRENKAHAPFYTVKKLNKDRVIYLDDKGNEKVFHPIHVSFQVVGGGGL